MRVIKRDGRKVAFDKEKIRDAVIAAFNDVDGEITSEAKRKATLIANNIESSDKKTMTVEEIQNIIEDGLMKSNRKDVAKSFILYRQTRTYARENTIDKTIDEIVRNENEYWNEENSNKDPKTCTTQRDYMAGAVSTDATRRRLLDKDIIEAHDNGIIHFHDMDYFIQKIHNCFSGDTKFYTSEGIKQFKDFRDGDFVQVLDKDGNWREATVHNYEDDVMYDITFATNKRSKVITCTANHRWVLKDGTVTTSLSVGDILYGLKDITSNYIPTTIDDCYMFSLGFLIGDGCDHKGHNYHQIRLCGNKIEYAPYIKKAGYNISTLDNGDLLAVKRGYMKQDFLNNKGWKYLSAKQKGMLFKGLYCADGATECNKLCTTDERIVELIQDISYCAGYHITSETIENRDTNYKNNSILFAFRFSVHQPDNLCWKVINIVPHDKAKRPQKTWCVEEPITHTFMLDGGMVTGNCDLVNIEDMLQNGTVISGVKIDNPTTFGTACTIATQIIAQVASSQYGGQSISIAHLSPFVDVSRKTFKKDYPDLTDEQIEKLVKKDIEDGVQTIQYQVVTLMTTNGQAPFITVYLNINEVPDGKEREDLAMVIEEVLKQRILGVKNEKGVYITPAFPKLIYLLDENNVHADSKYWYLTELAAKCSAKRLVPDYISAKVMREYKNGDTYTCMGCRSFLTPDRTTKNYANALNYDKYKGHKYYGRFNQGVVTINLVDVACSSERDMDKFWSILDERLELCHRALRARHERLLGTPTTTAPILWEHGALARLPKGSTIDELLYHGYSTISLGYAGLYEMCMYMTGKSHTDPEAKPFALKVMQALNDACAKWKAAEDIDYSVYGTPIESVTYKFAKCLQNRFGIIKDVTDHDYITNSYHVNVREEINAFDKLHFESDFQKLSPGGAISYIETANLQNNIDAVLTVIQYIYDNIMYAELNTKSDYCQVCGYDGEIQIVKDEETGKLVWECPNCKNRDQNTLNVARRTCGLTKAC